VEKKRASERYVLGLDSIVTSIQIRAGSNSDSVFFFMFNIHPILLSVVTLGDVQSLSNCFPHHINS